MALTASALARLRLRNQWITAPSSSTVARVVDHLVAVQAQDYPNARWALGMRLRGATVATVEQAFNRGVILRTHVLRPTWHFVRPADIRWLLALTGPRLQTLNASMYRRAGMQPAVFRRVESVLLKTMAGRALTRGEIREAFAHAGISMEREFKFTYALMHAELTGLICSGPRRGRQFTYALLDERVPPARQRSRDEALGELARRYFLSRSPATLHDMAKWSGLTLAECRLGLEAASPWLHSEVFAGQEFWLTDSAAPRPRSSTAHLLSVFDEYLSSYRPIPAIASSLIIERMRRLGPTLMGVVAIDGVIVGTWTRTLARDAAHIQVSPFGRFTAAQRSLIASAARRYASFHGLKAAVS